MANNMDATLGLSIGYFTKQPCKVCDDGSVDNNGMQPDDGGKGDDEMSNETDPRTRAAHSRTFCKTSILATLVSPQTADISSKRFMHDPHIVCTANSPYELQSIFLHLLLDTGSLLGNGPGQYEALCPIVTGP